MTTQSQIKTISKIFPNILSYSILGKVHFKVAPKDIWNFLFFLKMHTNTLCSQLIDLSMIDYPERKYRFEVFYLLLSLKYNNRFVVSTFTKEGTYLDSITNLYSSAGWYEREAWDMFGLFFRNHPDLRRILTDYGFKGHPLRKDFPMTGFVEVRYADSLKRIVYEKVSLPQEYRIFTLDNAWSEATTGL